ncbi:hypothetical protein [Rhodohalobacter sulfatireducens]|uniref:Uncharacterized protein n=1 Tax=Rhodohalobacter sulfatireducens TaxID=2911366 RepID=A0ABS9KCU2_9BACT|nr:hypothetical protein [Rhodohalobacter sulfatireducens]MCG2588679.1 hypothetical protein [Rhodohalobacter sulfatireducens]
MNTFVKQISLFIVLSLFTGYSAFGQQSDYQIQQDFQTEYTELLERIEQAVTTEALAEIEDAINELETNYNEHTDIINAALYPETFDNVIRTLRNNHAEAVENVTTIEDLNEEISSLESELDNFRSRLETMNRETADLQQKIRESTQNEARQAALIRQYRENIEERNLFVSNFLGDLLSEYQSMDRAQRQEITEAAGRLEENPVDVIQNVINEYITMMEQAEGLETPDFVSMKAQHGYFVEVWNQIGEQLTTTFMPDNPEQARANIDQLLSNWQESISTNLWASLQAAFSENDIQLNEFSSSDEFNDALHNYIDSAYEVSVDANSEEDYQVYRNFNSFWNDTVKTEWGEMFIEGDILTQAQIAAVDLKLDNWRDEATPKSNLTFILLIVSVAVIIGLIVLLLTRKSDSGSKT